MTSAVVASWVLSVMIEIFASSGHRSTMSGARPKERQSGSEDTPGRKGRSGGGKGREPGGGGGERGGEGGGRREESRQTPGGGRRKKGQGGGGGRRGDREEGKDREGGRNRERGRDKEGGGDGAYKTPNQPNNALVDSSIRDILSLLCGFGGRARVSHLQRHAQGNPYYPSLSEIPSLIFMMVKRPEMFALEPLEDGDTLVTVHTNLVLCLDHCTGSGCLTLACDALHLCKYFMISSCSAEKKKIECKYGHNYLSHHNAMLLHQHGLLNIHINHLKVIFRLNRSQATLPMVCKFYNTWRGCNNSGGNQCPGMHLCGHFLRGRCKFGNKCRQSHNVADRQPKTILLQYGFNVERHPDEILKEVKEQMTTGNIIQRPRHEFRGTPSVTSSHGFVKPKKMAATLAQAKSDKSEDVDEEVNICMFFLRGKCSYDTACRNYHAKLHYQWQMLGTDGKTWKDLKTNQNVETELNYTDPNKDECFLRDKNR